MPHICKATILWLIFQIHKACEGVIGISEELLQLTTRIPPTANALLPVSFRFRWALCELGLYSGHCGRMTGMMKLINTADGLKAGASLLFEYEADGQWTTGTWCCSLFVLTLFL